MGLIGRFFKTAAVLTGGFVFFVIFFLTAKSLLPVLPDMTLFRQIEFDLIAGRYSIPFFDIVFFFMGLFVFCYGLLVLVDVTSFNSSALDACSGNNRVLLSESHYAKSRHPMSGAIMLAQLGLFVSVRTLYMLVFVVLIMLVQAINCCIEEKFVLERLFGVDYHEYRKKVRAAFFSMPMRVIVIVVLAVVIAGLYFMKGNAV